MSEISLWRTVPQSDPFLGTGSYWALNREQAEEMAGMRRCAARAMHSALLKVELFDLYRTEIDLDFDRVLDLRDDGRYRFAQQRATTSDLIADPRYNWVIYLGRQCGTYEALEEAVYLGQQPVPAEWVA